MSCDPLSIVCFLQKVDDVILNPLILLVFVVAFMYFLYGIVKFLNPNTGEKDKLEARSAMLWGIVGMAIMFSVYGIIQFVLSTFGVPLTAVSNSIPPGQYTGTPAQ